MSRTRITRDLEEPLGGTTQLCPHDLRVDDLDRVPSGEVEPVVRAPNGNPIAKVGIDCDGWLKLLRRSPWVRISGSASCVCEPRLIPERSLECSCV